ncbi:40S ribosomal protein S7 [Amylocystis lapponica]|nr:40S ribosomal protein S7 [Amylocystis lapponica]
MATLGPQPQRIDVEEKLASFDSVPLFMKSLPTESTDDPVVGALQSLVFDGTPDEIAQNFKEQGNDYFRGKRYREAVQFYTQAVDAKPTETALLEALLCNRAACNLELENYGSVLRDCSKAITLNSKSSKAHFRSALALMALDRIDEALDCCERCLEFDKDNKSIQVVRDKAATRKAEKEEKEKERQEKIRREREQEQRMKIALNVSFAYQARNIVSLPRPADSVDHPYAPHFDPEDPQHTTLVVPVFFLYPQYATSDIVQHFVEDTPFSAHLSVMFPPEASPPEWDKNHQYVAGQLVIYAMTHRKRLLKVGKKMTLRDACKAAAGKVGEPRDGLEMKDGCLSFVVAPKGEVERKWGFLGSCHRASRVTSASPLRSSLDSNQHSGKLALRFKMSVQHKIFRTANAPTTPPDETEISVVQALIDLETNVPELKAELRPLQISAAREVDVRGGKKAIVIFVPVPQLKAFHKVQQRLTRELEKKFSDRHVVFVAQRRMLRKPTRTSRVKQKRPRSRTLTSVHEKILEDLVFPTEIVGKRTRVAVDGSKLLKVFLDSKDATSLEYKLDSFSSVYRRLTGKDVVFEFPVQAQE